MRQTTERPMAVAPVSVDALPTDTGRLVISVRQREALEDAELRFDQVQPRGFSRRQHGLDPQPAEQLQEARMVMDIVQIVHDHEEPFARRTSPQPPEGLAGRGDTLTPAKQTIEAVRMNVIEPQELLSAMRTTVGRAHASGPTRPRPGGAPDGPKFQGPPLIEAHYRRAPRTLSVEP